MCLALLFGSLLPANAIPSFARKYGFNCTMCHSNYPRLNDFGQRYRQNGYQLPGREADEKTVLQTTTPFSARITGGYDYDKFENTPGAENIKQFRITSVDVLSGGLFARNIGYLVVWPPKIEGSSGIAAQPGIVEMGNVIFSKLARDRGSIRAGRFEPAYAAFSVKRRLSFAPYEIYDFTFPGGIAFSDTADGIELADRSGRGMNYAAGWINGSSSDRLDDSPQDFYLRAAKVFGPGEGQTAGQRLGLVGYFGKARPLSGGSREGFNRIGIDGSANFDHWNVAIQLLRGADDHALWGTASDIDFSGGFVEGSYLPTTKFVGFARYDWVNTPGEIDQDVRRWGFGGRYYFVDQLAAHLEYSHRRQDDLTEAGDATEKFFFGGLDLAF
jgi:hypothetical protein